jgi:hypothetical protein
VTSSVTILSDGDAASLDLPKSFSMAELTFCDALIWNLNKIKAPFQMSSSNQLRTLISPDSNIDQDTLLTHLKDYIRTSDPDVIKTELEEILSDSMFYLPQPINIYLNGCLDGIQNKNHNPISGNDAKVACDTACNDYIIWTTIIDNVITEMSVISSPVIPVLSNEAIHTHQEIDPVSALPSNIVNTLSKACIYTNTGSLPPFTKQNLTFLHKLGITHIRVYVHHSEMGYYPANKDYINIDYKEAIYPEVSSYTSWVIVALLIVSVALVYVIAKRRNQLPQ